MTTVNLNIATGQLVSSEHETESNVVRFLSQKEFDELSVFMQVSGTSLAGTIESPSELRKTRETIASLLNSEDFEGLRKFVEHRSLATRYKRALRNRDRLKLQLEAMGTTLDKLRDQTQAKTKKISGPASIRYREASLLFREKHEAMQLLVRQLDEYRLITAQAAYASALIQEKHERANNTFLEYTAKSIGEMIPMGDYETNSPEWHEARASGIGGSDVGSIMRVEKAWASTNYTRMLHSKLGIEDPIQAKINPWDLRTGIGRGNAWEEFIRRMFALKNPKLNVAFCKTSWRGKELAHRRANFDGLILDTFGQPEGILEIKTSSDASKWGHESLGLDGVPAGYRKQVLWYAMNANLKYGLIAALIDDHDYREYRFEMSDPAIQEELQEIVAATDDFWAEIPKLRKKLTAGEPIVKKHKRGMKNSHDYGAIAEVYAGYAGISKTEAKRLIVGTIEAEKAAKGRLLSNSEFHKSVTAIFAKFDPATRERPFIGIDIETTTASARTGRIIETGIARLDNTGEIEVIYSSTHSIPADALAGVGLGPVEVHQLTIEQLEGAPSFSHPVEQKRILKMLKSGTLVAHNASFEDRFLTVNLPGYAEAKARGLIQILDTRKLASYLMARSDSSTLESFAEDNGIPYEGAHAATADAVMMLKALARLLKDLHKKGTFRVKRPTEAARARAKNEAESFQRGS